MVEWITNTMNSLGYWGIGLLMFLENLFPPIPSELIMPLAGFTVAQGNMQFAPVVVAGVVGTVVGALPWYYAGKILGEQRLKSLADRYGKWLTISSKDITKATSWFDKHGGKAVFFCRLVPGVRTLISLPAGISRMPLLPFLLLSTLVPEWERAVYRQAGERILESLYKNYGAFDHPEEEGLIMHGTSHYPEKQNVDVPLIYGDYFYVEGLARLRGNHQIFWE